jgi:hypothetical protein
MTNTLRVGAAFPDPLFNGIEDALNIPADWTFR